MPPLFNFYQQCHTFHSNRFLALAAFPVILQIGFALGGAGIAYKKIHAFIWHDGAIGLAIH
jgi:hypothetical protein